MQRQRLLATRWRCCGAFCLWGVIMVVVILLLLVRSSSMRSAVLSRLGKWSFPCALGIQHHIYPQPRQQRQDDQGRRQEIHHYNRDTNKSHYNKTLSRKKAADAVAAAAAAAPDRQNDLLTVSPPVTRQHHQQQQQQQTDRNEDHTNIHHDEKHDVNYGSSSTSSHNNNSNYHRQRQRQLTTAAAVFTEDWSSGSLTAGGWSTVVKNVDGADTYETPFIDVSGSSGAEEYRLKLEAQSKCNVYPYDGVGVGVERSLASLTPGLYYLQARVTQQVELYGNCNGMTGVYSYLMVNDVEVASTETLQNQQCGMTDLDPQSLLAEAYIQAPESATLRLYTESKFDCGHGIAYWDDISITPSPYYTVVFVEYWDDPDILYSTWMVEMVRVDDDDSFHAPTIHRGIGWWENGLRADLTASCDAASTNGIGFIMTRMLTALELPGPGFYRVLAQVHQQVYLYDMCSTGQAQSESTVWVNGVSIASFVTTQMGCIYGNFEQGMLVASNIWFEGDGTDILMISTDTSDCSTNTVYWNAIEISYMSGAPTHEPETSPTRSPTRSPTQSPTRAQTKSPTDVPTRSPISLPIRSPTRAPTRFPGRSPTRFPTRSPINSPPGPDNPSPTFAPTPVPQRALTKPPTPLPARGSAPTAAPHAGAANPTPPSRAPNPVSTTMAPPIPWPATVRSPVLTEPWNRNPLKEPTLAIPDISLPALAPTVKQQSMGMQSTTLVPAAMSPPRIPSVSPSFVPAKRPSSSQHPIADEAPSANGLNPPSHPSFTGPTTTTTSRSKEPFITMTPINVAPGHQPPMAPPNAVIGRDDEIGSSSGHGKAPDGAADYDDKGVIPIEAANATTISPEGNVVDEVWVYGVTLKLSYVSRMVRRLNHIDILGFERILSQMCLEYYTSLRNDGDAFVQPVVADEGEKGNVRRHRHRLLSEQRRRDARDVIQVDIVFVHQNLSYANANDMPLNVITYNQHFVFEPSNGQPVNDKNAEDEDEDDFMFTPSELSKLPFKDISWNMRLGNELGKNLPAFRNVELPFETPNVPDQSNPDDFLLRVDTKQQGNNKAFTQGAIAGIFFAVAFVFTMAGAYGLKVIDVPFVFYDFG